MAECDLTKAVALCKLLEPVAVKHGMHVALTGGCLYKKEGPRKDVDIVLYSVRPSRRVSMEPFLKEIAEDFDIKHLPYDVDLEDPFVYKATTQEGINIDFLVPEHEGTYEESSYGVSQGFISDVAAYQSEQQFLRQQGLIGG